MRIDIVTLFPEMFAGPFDASIVARARASGAVEVALHDPRAYTTDRHHVVDDYAYGGGPGMVMKPEPLFDCVDAVQAMDQPPGRVVLLTPQGRMLTHAVVRELAAEPRLVVICGHYEGVDERVRSALADDEISIGDYVLSGGEPAAIVLVDAAVRHQPGVLGSQASLEEESHAQGLLEYPQYTRPAEYRGLAVPEVLLSGDHAAVARWRRRQSIERTAARRPDLLARAALTAAERWLLAAAAGASREVSLAEVTVTTPDLERSVMFYAAILGDAGDRLSADRHEFRLQPLVLAIIRSKPERPPAVEADADDERMTFAVDDARAAQVRVRAAGALWVERRVHRRAGARSFFARDPDGNVLCFAEEEPP
ncbi:MAG: tRNA (guanosine(37)-N1)-methyltransferase TrmD [Dehalococcoidia bacterium]|nr:tRNA (guanosine(37)-N1)-methyltransferase TrmD [Dehalococcoidia bacterium]